MVKLNQALALAMTLFFLSACGDDDPEDTVTVRMAPDVDLTQYRTFAFAQPEALPENVRARIPENVMSNLLLVDSAVDIELRAHGLVPVGPDQNPDLQAFSVASTQEETGVVWSCAAGYGWYGSWYWGWDPCSWLEPIPVSYTTGTVLLGLVDRAQQRVVFGGVIQGVEGDPDDRQKRIERGVETIFDDYPFIGEAAN